MIRMLLAVIIAALSFPGYCLGEPQASRRGLVTSSDCPYGCKDAGLSAADCTERKVGDTCQIEDFTQPPGHRSMVRVNRGDFTASDQQVSRSSSTTLAVDEGRRGLITSTSCPYTCRDAGLSDQVCRESRVGNTCRVEDLTQPPGHRTLVRVAAEGDAG